MRAVQVMAFDGPDAVTIREVAAPQPERDDILIDVRAAAVTYPDVLHTRGLYQERFAPPFTLGGECSGIVRAAPPGARFTAGDRVVAVLRHGAFAEQVAVPEFLVQPLPDNVTFVKGACLSINYLTAHYALHARGDLSAGETVLVHGAAGGVGTATIQLARAFGARVIAVTSSAEKAALAQRVGAHEIVEAATFSQQVHALTGGDGVDLVVDPVGGDRFTDSLRCLRAPGGRLLVVGFTSGAIPTVKVNRLLLTNTDVRGVGWGGPAFSTPGFVTGQWEALAPRIREGVLDPAVADVLPMSKAAEALTALEQRRALGRFVLTP